MNPYFSELSVNFQSYLNILRSFHWFQTNYPMIDIRFRAQSQISKQETIISPMSDPDCILQK